MQANRNTPLAASIQEKLDHQGFLTSAELNPLLGLAIEHAMQQKDLKGILIDGFPRCEEQLNSWAQWPFQDKLPLEGDGKPDVVLLLNVTRDNAQARYMARGRDQNDSLDKFAKRFTEYLTEGPPVERYYREAGLLIDVDNNGTVEENIAGLKRKLSESSLWSHAVMDQEMRSFFLL
ncbi:adenylate kinase [Coniella lustricola]|uniref:Adenylate kinase n=1 Tax=Coniella lustricola TaxID=2025994 RepID=A0A2T3A781_9PEZI|nr:adenylate kinase [Coniella lustricola]